MIGSAFPSIKLKKFKGMMCIAATSRGAAAPLQKVLGGKYIEQWSCLATSWSTANIMKLTKFAREYGWRWDLESKILAYDAARGILDPESRQHIDSNVETLAGVSKLLKTQLWQHQRDAFIRLHGLTGNVLDLGMGCGKTLLAIALILAGKHDSGIIVCPKSVIDVWPSEFEKHSKERFCIYIGPKSRSASIKQYYEGLVESKHKAEKLKLPFVAVMNYEKMWRDSLGEYLLANRQDYVVYDEAHRLKSSSGVASKFATKLHDSTDRVIGCTGTLLPHSPIDAFGVFRAIDPAIFGRNFINFRVKYAEMGGFENKQIVGFKNQEDLHRKISWVSHRVKSEDVLDLPDTQHITRYCYLEPKTQKIYDQMESALFAQVGSGEVTAANAMVKVLRLQQITSGIITDTDGHETVIGQEKARLLLDILEDIDPSEPVVVFCRFTADVQQVRTIAEQLARPGFELSGKVNQLNQWKEAGTGILATQIQAGKEGIDLTMSCIQIYYSIGHSLGDYEQSLKRSHRPGQTRKVRYFHLLAKDTIDEKVYQSLDKKRDIVLSILEYAKHRSDNEAIQDALDFFAG